MVTVIDSIEQSLIYNINVLIGEANFIQTDKQTDIQILYWTDKQIDRVTGRHTQRERNTHTNTHTLYIDLHTTLNMILRFAILLYWQTLVHVAEIPDLLQACFVQQLCLNSAGSNRNAHFSSRKCSFWGPPGNFFVPT